ncbi:MAG: hypothetical protein OQK32_06970, partial [Gammaproteobacteria bacterium]|nr:hypothetical protein [Gammaproteobacteria bacterium]
MTKKIILLLLNSFLLLSICFSQDIFFDEEGKIYNNRIYDVKKAINNVIFDMDLIVFDTTDYKVNGISIFAVTTDLENKNNEILKIAKR